MLFMLPKAQSRLVGLRDALEKGFELARVAGSREAALAVHVRYKVRSGYIREVLGDVAAGHLMRGTTEIRGIKLHVITKRIRSHLVRGPVVAAYLAPSFLDKLLKDQRATDIISPAADRRRLR